MVASSLEQVPSGIHAVYGTDDEGNNIVHLRFDYLSGDETNEATGNVEVQDSAGNCAVGMIVGNQTGRIHRLSMGATDLSPKSIEVIADGIKECFQRYTRKHNLPLRRQAILASIANLVRRFLPQMAADLREPMKS